MDRRQRKSREAIFRAFVELLSKKTFERITVGEIIERADIGRATFYAHFETKGYLLREFCKELFCHIFDAARDGGDIHRHIFECDSCGSVFLHLFRHLEKNDNNVLELLSCDNNELFLGYFKEGLKGLIRDQLDLFDGRRAKELPEDFFVNHVAASFVETVIWWIDGGMKESPETLEKYFLAVV